MVGREGVEQVKEMAKGLLYIRAVPASKVRVGLCHLMAGGAGEGSAQERQQSLWQTQRAILGRAGS